MNYLIKIDFYVTLFNPLETSVLRQRRIRKTKIDKIDAEVIADGLKLDTIENRNRYHSQKNYLKLKGLTLIHRKIVDKISDLTDPVCSEI